MTLPTDLGQLEYLLDEQLEKADHVLEVAKAKNKVDRRQRKKVLEDYLKKFQVKLLEAEEIGDPDATAHIEVTINNINQEILQIADDIEEEQKVESTVDYERQLKELVERAEAVREQATQVDIDEIECLVHILVGEARLLQENGTTILAEYEDLNTGTRRLFGKMTAICKDYLNADSIYIKALQPDWREHWPEYIEIWSQELERRRNNKQAAAKREVDKAESARRQENNLKLATTELEGFLSEEADRESAQWIADFRILVLCFCEHGGAASSSEDLLLELVEHEDLIIGSGTRSLRRKFDRLLGRKTKAPSESAELEAVSTEEIEEEREHPYERLRGYFEGKAAVIVGGTPREKARQAIEDFFGFEVLEWANTGSSSKSNTNIGSLARRIKGDQYDVVFALVRYMGHTIDDRLKPSCKSRKVPYVQVISGYGVNSLCKALEDSRTVEPAT